MRPPYNNRVEQSARGRHAFCSGRSIRGWSHRQKSRRYPQPLLCEAGLRPCSQLTRALYGLVEEYLKQNRRFALGVLEGRGPCGRAAQRRAQDFICVLKKRLGAPNRTGIGANPLLSEIRVKRKAFRNRRVLENQRHYFEQVSDTYVNSLGGALSTM